MGTAKLTETLISDAQLISGIGADDLTDAQWLTLFNWELQTNLIGLMRQARENYNLFTEVIPLADGVSRYKIPDRSAGSGLRDVKYEDAGGRIFQIDFVEISDRHFYNYEFAGAKPRRFEVYGADLKLRPEIISDPVGSLVFIYTFMPSSLVLTTRYAQITAVNENTKTITIDKSGASFPSVFTASVSGSPKYDIQLSAGSCFLKKIDLTAASVDDSAGTITFNESIGHDADTGVAVAVGDYVMLAGEAALPQVPEVCHPLLVQMAVVKALEAAGFTEEVVLHSAQLDKMKESIQSLLEPRMIGNVEKITGDNNLRRSGRFNRRIGDGDFVGGS